MRVVVVGGGVAGAATAIALRRIGAEVTIYEAYPEPAGPCGSFISLASNGLRGLAALGCLTQVQQAGFPVERQRMWSGSGKLLGDVPRGRRGSDPLLSVTILREKLVAVLRAEAVRLGARLAIGERVAAADDRFTEADLVVGADGIWSGVRRALDSAAPVPGYAGMYTVSGFSRDHGAAPGNFNMIFGRGGAFIFLPAPDCTVWWSAQVGCPVAPSLRGIGIPELTESFRREPQVLDILRAATTPLTATLNHVLPEVSRQAGDRMVLVGDAAHPVGAGQGASMAIEDAVVLARELSTGQSISAALASFGTLRHDRLGRMAKTAAANRDAKTAGPLASRVRDLVMPITFNRFYEKATGWLYDYDPGALPAVR